jgi:cytochrome c5
VNTTPTAVCAALCMSLSSQALAEGKPLPDGKLIYDRVCYKCHRSGTLGAPSAGNKQAWAHRVKNGIGSLYKSALNGKNDMPPRGGKEELTDEEVKAAVDYMLSLTELQAGEGRGATGGALVK